MGGLNISAKRWGNKSGRRVLALHGWLDNCASFDFLAQELDEVDLVCIDCMGHGRSDFRPHLGAYNVWQDTHDVFAVADQLGWDRFALLGHSRGSMIAFLCAGAIPDRIEHLFCVEGLLPRTSLPEGTPELLKQSIEAMATAHKRPRHIYPSMEDAIQARVKGIISVAYDDAKTLAQWGVERCDDGFYWRYDYKLMMQSELRLSQTQLDAFRDRIKCATTLLLANRGLLIEQAAFLTWLKNFSGLDQVTISGQHHLHMSENASGVAAVINERL